jgi:hypothetical protein
MNLIGSRRTLMSQSMRGQSAREICHTPPHFIFKPSFSQKRGEEKKAKQRLRSCDTFVPDFVDVNERERGRRGQKALSSRQKQQRGREVHQSPILDVSFCLVMSTPYHTWKAHSSSYFLISYSPASIFGIGVIFGIGIRASTLFHSRHCHSRRWHTVC